MMALSDDTDTSANNDDYSLVGKKVIIRSRNEGINFGTVKKADSTGVVLSGAIRIWYHKPKDKSLCWYEGVSISGLSDDSKVSASVEEKHIIEEYSATICTLSAIASIEGFKQHEQN